MQIRKETGGHFEIYHFKDKGAGLFMVEEYREVGGAGRGE